MTASTPAARLNTTDMLRQLMGMVEAELPADAVCVCSYDDKADLFELLTHHAANPALLFDVEQMQNVIRRHIKSDVVSNFETLLLAADDLTGTPFHSVLIFRLSMHDELIGLLVLFSTQDNYFTPEDAARVAFPVSMIGTTIENLHLYDMIAHQMIVTEAIFETTRLIGQDPSPQNIVDVMHAFLFDAHISGCALLLYGPVSEDRPYGPFQYLEVVGWWASRIDSPLPIGTKLYLQDSDRILEELGNGEPLVFRNAGELADQLDPFSRSLIRASRAASIALLPLRSGERRLGMIVIGTEQPHEFSAQELDTYRAVSEFLAISAMSQVLQQQHDSVAEGRVALLDAVSEGVVMILPEGGSGRVLTVNQRFTSVFGVSDDTAQGMALEDLLARMQLPEPERRELRSMWFSVPLRDPITQKGEFHMIHSDGYPLDIEWYSAPVYQKNGHVLGRIYTFRDVTAERMAVQVRSAFLSRVSHELRTPLTSIHGFAEFILEVTGEQLPPLAREYTQIILSSAKHLRAIFTDMIEMTRADAGELRLNMRSIHLPDIILDTVARLELQYKRRNQTVMLDLDDDLPRVSVDPDRIVQVLTNLLMNAVKYSPDDGKIHIATQHITRLPELPKGSPPDLYLPAILVSIIDEGEGLSQEDVEQIFQPFFRTEWARVNKVEGTGLGLAVSRSIIELHRGKIWAEVSTPKHPGGRFLFSIPITTEG